MPEQDDNGQPKLPPIKRLMIWLGLVKKPKTEK